MFEQLAAKQIIYENSRVSAVLTFTLNFFDRRNGSNAIVIETDSRNAGSLSAELLVPGTETQLAYGITDEANGAIYLLPVGTIPKVLQLRVTPDAFDGNAEISVRSAGLTRNLAIVR